METRLRLTFTSPSEFGYGYDFAARSKCSTKVRSSTSLPMPRSAGQPDPVNFGPFSPGTANPQIIGNIRFWLLADSFGDRHLRLLSTPKQPSFHGMSA